MSKFLKNCLWFLLLIILLNILYVSLLLSFSPAFIKTHTISTFKSKNYELLILGNSMALDGIDAEYLSQNGLNSYNLALAGDHVSTSLLILDNYLKNNDKPKMVIIGLSSAIGRGYLNKVPFKNPEVEFFYNPSLVSNIKNPPILNFQWLAVDMFKIVISKDHRNANLIRGQWKTQKVIPDNTTFKSMAQPNITYTNDFLFKIIEKCENQGIKVILVELPGSNTNNNCLPFEYSVELGNKKTKTVYNLNNYEISSNLIDPSTDWLAPDHLNEKGAKKITEFLNNHVIKKELNLTPLTNIK